MQKYAALIFLTLLVACAQPDKNASEKHSVKQDESYNAQSWQTLIADSCLRFFDGCNNCRRSAAGEVAACTRKACFKYKKPTCLDGAK